MKGMTLLTSFSHFLRVTPLSAFTVVELGLENPTVEE